MTTPQTAFGVCKGDHVYVSTIFGTRLGAIRNWLCTDAGIMLPAATSDADAETLWAQHSKVLRVEVKELTIEVRSVRP